MDTMARSKSRKKTWISNNKIVKKIMKKLNLGANEKIITKGVGISFLGIFLVYVLSFFLLMTKTRLMSPEEVGLLVLATSIALTAFIIGQGFSLAVLRYASLFKGKGKIKEIKGVVITVYKYAIPFLAGILILVNFFSRDIALHIFHKEQLSVLIKIISFATFFGSIIHINSSLLRSKYLVQYRYIFEVIKQLFTVLVILALFLLKQKNFLILFAWVWAIANFFIMIYSFFIVKREFPFIFDGKISYKVKKRKIFLFSFISFLAIVMNRFRKEINIFIISFFLLASDIALYNVALQIGLIASVFLRGLNNIFPPLVGKLYGQRKIAEIKRLHKKTALIIFIGALGVFIFYIFLGKYILWLFGPYYQEAFIPLLIIAFASALHSIVGSAGSILVMLDRPHLNTGNIFISLILLIILSYYLTPLYGVTGAAIAFAISQLTMRLLDLIGVLWVYKIEERTS